MRQRRPAIAGRRDFVGPEIKAPPPDVGGGAVGASLGGDCFLLLLQAMQIIDCSLRMCGGGEDGAVVVLQHIEPRCVQGRRRPEPHQSRGRGTRTRTRRCGDWWGSIHGGCLIIPVRQSGRCDSAGGLAVATGCSVVAQSHNPDPTDRFEPYTSVGLAGFSSGRCITTPRSACAAALQV